MTDSQSQKAGDNSSQFQVAGDYVEGVTLEQALEVADLTARKVAAEEFARAEVLAKERMDALNERVIRELDHVRQLAAFGDPGFRIALRKAEIGAASSERTDDYEMLAKLLGDRAVRGGDRKVRAGLDGAIAVVDQLDESALLGLTVALSVVQFRPINGSLDSALDLLDLLMSQNLKEGSLPTPDSEWLDHLDVLGAVRTSQISGVKPYQQVLTDMLPGLICVGVQAGSDDALGAHAELQEAIAGIEPIDHELKPGYQRLPFTSSDVLETALKDTAVSPELASRVAQLAREKFQLDSPDGALLPEFMNRVEQRTNLNTVKTWWDAAPSSFQFTAIGKVLARADARRRDTLGLLPPLV